MTDVRDLGNDAIRLAGAKVRMTIGIIRAAQTGSETVGGISPDDLRMLLRAHENTLAELKTMEELRDRREDRAYANGAKQTMAIAEQSMDSARTWAAEGYGGRTTPIAELVR